MAWEWNVGRCEWSGKMSSCLTKRIFPVSLSQHGNTPFVTTKMVRPGRNIEADLNAWRKVSRSRALGGHASLSHPHRVARLQRLHVVAAGLKNLGDAGRRLAHRVLTGSTGGCET